MDRATAHRQALNMLDAFASVGATTFDVTFKVMETEDRQFRKAVPIGLLKSKIPETLDQATRLQRNVIVRPHNPPVFLQLDDLKTAALDRVAPAAFLTLDTSPGNHQAWLAIDGTPADDFASRLRKGAGADLYASGATRIAGSLNFKPKYEPDFPLIAIGQVRPGRSVTPAELEALGLVAAPEPMPATRPRVSHQYDRPQRERPWPDYQKCLDGAPLNATGDGPKRAMADFTWCMLAADWGFPLDATIGRLMEQSTKAIENGKGYAIKTAQKAAAAAARNRRNPSPRP